MHAHHIVLAVRVCSGHSECVCVCCVYLEARSGTRVLIAYPISTALTRAHGAAHGRTVGVINERTP